MGAEPPHGHRLQQPPIPAAVASAASLVKAPWQGSLRARKFQRLLGEDSVNLGALRELLWAGAPEDDPWSRAQAWQMLLGYMPPVRDRQEQGVEKKRREYEELKRRHYHFEEESEDAAGVQGGSISSSAPVSAGREVEEETHMLGQIRKDLPRTAQGTFFPMFNHPRMHRLMERVLYIWSVRHPASGYVQGINDLLTPFIVVLLASELRQPVEDLDVDSVASSIMESVEAGAYWCLTKVLSDIQDHYTSGQPGIQQMVLKLKGIIRRIDATLYQHLEDQGIDFLSFSFRWMNCLLMREFPLPCVIRLWDTYIAEPSEGFSTFHVYVCAVFLIYWSPQLKQMDFQQLMLFMQKIPTGKWRNNEIETLLAEAYVLKSLFHSSPKHLAVSNESPTALQNLQGL